MMVANTCILDTQYNAKYPHNTHTSFTHFRLYLKDLTWTPKKKLSTKILLCLCWTWWEQREINSENKKWKARKIISPCTYSFISSLEYKITHAQQDARKNTSTRFNFGCWTLQFESQNNSKQQTRENDTCCCSRQSFDLIFGEKY